MLELVLNALTSSKVPANMAERRSVKGTASLKGNELKGGYFFGAGFYIGFSDNSYVQESRRILECRVLCLARSVTDLPVVHA